ncbi:MAG: Asp23/Gls24 family envelope stress response protein [Clostridia bacterium]|nr:Asp23/Gls24 family envelope stress response protein [Clostridia bacterium]
MAHIRHDSASPNGKVVYNSEIVSGIVALAINEVDGVSLLNTKNRGVKLSFEKQGIVADISVKVEASYNVPSLAFSIQQSIKHNVESMTKYKVAKVDVHIQDVDFSENSAL